MMIEIRTILDAGRSGYRTSQAIGDSTWFSVWQFWAVAWLTFKGWLAGRWWRTR